MSSGQQRERERVGEVDVHLWQKQMDPKLETPQLKRHSRKEVGLFQWRDILPSTQRFQQQGRGGDQKASHLD